MDTSPVAYLLKAAGKRRPTVWLETQEAGYFYRIFNERKFPDGWAPPIRMIRGLSYALPDAVLWTGPGPLISESAVDLFTAVAPGCASYPFFSEIKGRPYFAINILESTDAIDEQRSKVNRAKSGAITSIRKHAFNPGVVLPPIFKLPDRLDCDLYCTTALASAIVENRLKGFSFWDPSAEHLRDLYLGKDLNCVDGVRT